MRALLVSLPALCAIALLGCAPEPADDQTTAVPPPSTRKAELSTEPAQPGYAAPAGESGATSVAAEPDEAPPADATVEDQPAAEPVQPAAVASSGSWTHWRGPLQTGAAPDLDLPQTWSQDGENLLWSNDFACRSCPVIINGRVYIIGVAGDKVSTQERVACFDAETGQVLWEHRFNVFHSNIVRARVGWANLAADEETGYVYAHGVQDLLFCFDADGNIVWSRSLKEEFGSVTGYGGRVHTPVVDEDRLVISFLNSNWGNHGRPLHRYLALDKRTGEVLWWAAPGDGHHGTTYSTPVFTVVDGRRLMIAGNSDGNIYAMKARTGQTVWKFRLTAAGMNASVVADGKRVYACHGEENLDSTVAGRLVCIDATGSGDVTQTHELWRYDGIQAGYASPALHDGRLYLSDESANLHCFDAGTGDLIWEHKIGNAGRGSTPVWADGKLYVTENQSFHILRPGPGGCESLDMERFVGQRGIVELWGAPAVAGGRVYFGTSERFYALGKTPWSGETAVLPAAPTEPSVDTRAQPAAIHVVPGEVTLAPGGSTSFEVRAYDDSGRFLKTVAAEYTLDAGLKGELTSDGRFNAPGANSGGAGIVQATVGRLTALARVRVVPTVPFAEDFESYEPGAVPPHWGTSRAKFGVVELDGGKVLRKTNVNPVVPVARTIAFIATSESTGYTISADMRGTEVRFRLPEMGLVNNRYRLVLFASNEQLAITSWDALPRLDVSVDYPVDPDVWYRMKMRVDVHDERAVIRGKVWLRTEPEPEQWTIEAEDPVPNRQGSPGLYAYSSAILEGRPGTEVFFDNVRVDPNQPQ